MRDTYFDILESIGRISPLFKNDFIKDVNKFFCRIMSADKRISKAEIDYINRITEQNLTKEDLKKMCKEYKNDSNSYPRTVELLAEVMESHKELQYDCMDVLATIYLFFSTAGIEFLASDDNYSPSESKVLSHYISATKKRIDEIAEMAEDEDEEAQEEDIEESLSLDELMEELNSLTGLAEVKSEIESAINLVKVRKLREARGFTNLPMSLHMVFMGNPGTGKTTVARLLAKIYKCIGVLSKGHLVEVDRADLVAGYIGQTAIKTKEAIESAVGGILFIDEAYTLTHNKSDNDYGIEAIDTIVKFMEDNRCDLIVVAAGYPDEMVSFINSNPGLKSRFTKYIDFKDYNNLELFEIFESICRKNHYKLSDTAKKGITDFLSSMKEEEISNFGNARGIRNIFEACISNQANRIASMESVDDDALITIEAVDIY